MITRAQGSGVARSAALEKPGTSVPQPALASRAVSAGLVASSLLHELCRSDTRLREWLPKAA
jgi:hypothetical protein